MVKHTREFVGYWNLLFFAFHFIFCSLILHQKFYCYNTKFCYAVNLLYLLGFMLIVWDTFQELRSCSVSPIFILVSHCTYFVYKQLGSGLSPYLSHQLSNWWKVIQLKNLLQNEKVVFDFYIKKSYPQSCKSKIIQDLV